MLNIFAEHKLFNTYKRFPVCFVSGSGAKLYDANGKEYIDCLAGIAVCSAGHANPEIARAVAEQAAKLVHVSNYFWTEPMAQLAAKLNQISGGWGLSFFANSGAEANECAIKLARRWAGPGRYKILCAEGAFHGRTLTTLSATGQPEKWAGFEPLTPGFVHLPFNDLGAFERAVDGETAAVMLEPIQGERGVIPATAEFFSGIRQLCDANNIALILDEIQTGVGRTGSWWAFQTYGIKPDIFTSAKALANGLPIGVCIADEPFASAFGHGDHGSTFGGGPVVCMAALAALNFIESQNLLGAIPEKERLFRDLLGNVPGVREVRGRGLMLACVLDAECAPSVVEEALARGVVVNAPNKNTLRLVPPLVISEAEIRTVCSVLSEAIRRN